MAMAGLWVGCSDSFSARLVRGVCDDFTRDVGASLKPTPAQWNSNALTAAWLGHATVLLNFYGTTILTDPVMFERVGYKIGDAVIGRKRLVAPALSIAELPKIDLVLLSHAHMDHFDVPTLKTLHRAASVITASRTSDLLPAGFRSVTELKWDQKATVRTSAGSLEVQAFEVNHSGARWSSDTYRGYNGYLLRKDGRQVLFGGDTALTSTFKDLHGKTDLGLMPIGSYGRIGSSHCTPEQAVKMANDAGVQHFLPIHHKTFPIGGEPIAEPLQRLEAAIEPERIALRDIGATFKLA